MFAGLIPFSIYNSLRIERDFQQRNLPFNTVDGGIYYIWRSVPQIYIPVDYYRMNLMNQMKHLFDSERQEEAIRKEIEISENQAKK